MIILIIYDSLLAPEAVAARLGDAILVRSDRLDVNLKIVVEQGGDDEEDPCANRTLLEEDWCSGITVTEEDVGNDYFKGKCREEV